MAGDFIDGKALGCMLIVYAVILGGIFIGIGVAIGWLLFK